MNEAEIIGMIKEVIESGLMDREKIHKIFSIPHTVTATGCGIDEDQIPLLTRGLDFWKEEQEV